MYPYIPNTPEDEKVMMDAIGIKNVDELFSDIPDEIRFKRRLNLDSPKSEFEVKKIIKNLADKNISVNDLTCFLGAGAYDHYIPSVVKHVISRSEFYTAYTPYQAEISQGTLQAVFEYQTMISNLTGMDASNASLYDGATACAEAALLAKDATRRNTILVSKTVNPEIRKVLETYTRFKGLNLVEIDYADGETDIEKLKSQISNDTAGVIVQNPNFFGIIEDYTEVEKLVHANKSLLVMDVDPIACAILKTPAEIGADIAVGEGQSLGNHLSYGGPYIGFMAVTKKLMRKMPGRIVGQTVDTHGKRAFVLTLQAREQHIRREKATSNICSNEALNALACAVYMTALGKNGMIKVAKMCLLNAHKAYKKLTQSGKFKPVFKDKPFFMEFAVKSDLKASKVNEALLNEKIIGGFNLEKEYPELSNALLFCATEKRTDEDINKLSNVLEGLK